MDRPGEQAPGGATYGIPARLLHWASAVVVVTLLVLGPTMVRLVESDLTLKFWLYQLHKSLGVTVLALTAGRLAWRLWQPPPVFPATLAAWERRAARANHLTLYALLVLTPLSGWAMVSVSTLPVGTIVFGWLPWPHIPLLEALPLETRQEFEPAAKWLHRGLAVATGGLATLHVAAALRHHFVAGDDVLRRMWFSRGKRLAALAGVVFLALELAASPAVAASWTVDPRESVLTFEARAGSQIIVGKFERFTAHITFDPAHPKSSRVKASIEIASVSTGQSQIDQALRTEAWFDAARHPEAHFDATGGEAVADGRYALAGMLTLRGVRRPLAIVFSLKSDGRRAVASARFTLDREAFGIGQVAIARRLAIARDVVVSINVHAARAERPE